MGLWVSQYSTLAERITLSRLVDTASPPPHVIAWAVRHAARFVPRATCLTQALALQYLLARTGRSSLIRIGVAEGSDGAFEAHAWLIHDDSVLIGNRNEDVSRFVPLTNLLPKQS